MESQDAIAMHMKSLLTHPAWEYITLKIGEGIESDIEQLTDPDDPVNKDELPESKRLRYQMLVHLKVCKYLLSIPQKYIDGQNSATVLGFGFDDSFE